MVDLVLTLPQEHSLNTEKFSLETLLSSPDLFIHASPNDALESTLTRVESSHEPVLVINSNSLQGLLSLTDALYKSRLPPGTKVKRIMFTPPKLTKSSDLFKIAEGMRSTRIYALPVFEKDEIVGVIELANILKWLVADKDNAKTLAAAAEISNPITINKSAVVKEAVETFKKLNISRLVVVNDEGKLEGILTRNQLRRTYLTPSNRQRFGKTQDPKNHVFDPAEVVKRDNTTIIKLFTPTVFTGKAGASEEEIVTSLINSSYNSVVIINEDRKPVGFLSNRGLLDAVLKLQPPAP